MRFAVEILQVIALAATIVIALYARRQRIYTEDLCERTEDALEEMREMVR